MKQGLRSVALLGLILPLMTSVFAWAGGEVPCPPDQTADSLEDFRDALTRKIVSGGSALAKSVLNRCFPGAVPKCFQDMRYYVTDFPDRPSDGYYGSGDSAATTPRNETLTMSSERELPPEFLVKDSSGQVMPGQIRIPPNIKELAAQKGWKAASYKTRSTGGFDAAPNLTIVAIPGRDKDIFLQISPPPDANREATEDDPHPHPPDGDLSHGQSTLTVITTDKTKSPHVGQLRKLSGDGFSYMWSNTLKDHGNNCTSCHASPLRSISPRGYRTTNGTERRMSPEEERNIAAINDMMVQDGVSWGSYTMGDREVRRGPPIDSQPWGWAPPGSRTREEEFVKRCSSDLSSVGYRGFGGYGLTLNPTERPHVDWQKVAMAMNCTQCHNNMIRGKLHSGFAFDEIQFKTLVDRSMPPGFDLNQDERLALVKCLSAEREEVAPKWRSSGEWLKADACVAAPVRMQPRGSGGTSPVNQ